MAGMLILCFLFLFSCSAWSQDQPCPFEPTSCICRSNSAKAYDFEVINCQSATLPSLQGPPGVKYMVKSLSITSNDVYKIQNGYFASFASIEGLHLIRNSDIPMKQEFEPNAFDKTTITNIHFSGLDGILPLPDSLNLLAQHGLKGLYISRHGALSLNKCTFKYFVQLTKLSIDQTVVTDLTSEFFCQIWMHLNELSFTNVGWTEYPSALSQTMLLVLESLNLSGNQIRSIPKYDLGRFDRLSDLDLSGNPLGPALLAGDFNLAPFVQNLRLAETGLTAVPAEAIARNILKTIDLSRNKITAVRDEDFKNTDLMEEVILDQNPITIIEAKSFPYYPLYALYKSISLKKTNMAIIDLHILTDVGPKLEHLWLDDNALMRVVNMSKPDHEVPPNLSIHLRNTSVQIIDQNCKSLLEGHPGVTLNIGSSRNLHCKSLNWMAPYVLNSKQIIADDALCKDMGNLPLKTYLMGLSSSTSLYWSSSSRHKTSTSRSTRQSTSTSSTRQSTSTSSTYRSTSMSSTSKSTTSTHLRTSTSSTRLRTSISTSSTRPSMSTTSMGLLSSASTSQPTTTTPALNGSANHLAAIVTVIVATGMALMNL